MDLPHSARRIGVIPAILMLLIGSHADAAIGRTPGSASVTPDGEAAYTIPLAVPPGTNGMTPALSLEYRIAPRAGCSASAGRSAAFRRSRDARARSCRTASHRA
ncbi:MAG: hypothetical protein HC807_08655 [Gammaproteobacteria bacterium]|nr:hypothetical protein [Gammaproteobacteria bacterium]